MARLPATASAIRSGRVGLERAVGEVAVEADGDAQPADHVEHGRDGDVGPARGPSPRRSGTAAMQREQGDHHEHVDPDLLRDAAPAVEDRAGGPGRACRALGNGHRVLSEVRVTLLTPVYRQSEHARRSSERSKIEPEEGVLHHFRQPGVDPVLARRPSPWRPGRTTWPGSAAGSPSTACGPMMCAPSSLPVPRSAMQLAEAGGVLHRPAVGDVAVVLDLHGVVEPVGPALRLGAADRRRSAGR